MAGDLYFVRLYRNPDPHVDAVLWMDLSDGDWGMADAYYFVRAETEEVAKEKGAELFREKRLANDLTID